MGDYKALVVGGGGEGGTTMHPDHNLVIIMKIDFSLRLNYV